MLPIGGAHVCVICRMVDMWVGSFPWGRVPYSRHSTLKAPTLWCMCDVLAPLSHNVSLAGHLFMQSWCSTSSTMQRSFALGLFKAGPLECACTPTLAPTRTPARMHACTTRTHTVLPTCSTPQTALQVGSAALCTSVSVHNVTTKLA